MAHAEVLDEIESIIQGWMEQDPSPPFDPYSSDSDSDDDDDDSNSPDGPPGPNTDDHDNDGPTNVDSADCNQLAWQNLICFCNPYNSGNFGRMLPEIEAAPRDGKLFLTTFQLKNEGLDPRSSIGCLLSARLGNILENGAWYPGDNEQYVDLVADLGDEDLFIFGMRFHCHRVSDMEVVIGDKLNDMNGEDIHVPLAWLCESPFQPAHFYTAHRQAKFQYERFGGVDAESPTVEDIKPFFEPMGDVLAEGAAWKLNYAYIRGTITRDTLVLDLTKCSANIKLRILFVASKLFWMLSI